ncbi:hypothetical protein SMU68_09224, partial [Streptococcus mutans NFSM1]
IKAVFYGKKQNKTQGFMACVGQYCRYYYLLKNMT